MRQPIVLPPWVVSSIAFIRRPDPRRGTQARVPRCGRSVRPAGRTVLQTVRLSYASMRLCVLPLTELEPLPGSRPPGLLPLHRARIAGEETAGPKLGPMQLVGQHQGPRDPHPERPGLARLPAPVHVRPHVEGAQGVGGRERLLDVLHQRGAREVVAQGPAVDLPLAGARGEVHPGDAGLPPADRVPAELIFTHALTLTAKGRGCCATWGCSAPAYTLSLSLSRWRESEFLGSMPKTAFSITCSGAFSSRFLTGVKLSWPM